MRRLTLAIDFDGTIVEESWPDIGAIKPGAKEVINQLVEDGHYIIIWTMRHGKYRYEAEHFLWMNQISFHKINENHPASFIEYETDTRKVGADIFIDDKNILGLPETWEEIYHLITQKANQPMKQIYKHGK